MVTRREIDETEQLKLQGFNTIQHLEDVWNRPAVGIQPYKVQCESPFVLGLGFGHEVHLAPLGGPRLLYATKLKQCLSLGDVVLLILRRRLYTLYTVPATSSGTLVNPRNESCPVIPLASRVSHYQVSIQCHQLPREYSGLHSSRDEAHPFTRLGVTNEHKFITSRRTLSSGFCADTICARQQRRHGQVGMSQIGSRVG